MDMGAAINLDCSLDDAGNTYWMWNTFFMLSHDFVNPINKMAMVIITALEWVEFVFTLKNRNKKIGNCIVLSLLVLILLSLDVARGYQLVF